MPPNILKIIADNPSLYEALLAHVEQEFADNNNEVDQLNDTELGQRTRARVTGVNTVRRAFAKLLKYQTPKEQIIKVLPR